MNRQRLKTIQTKKNKNVKKTGEQNGNGKKELFISKKALYFFNNYLQKPKIKSRCSIFPRAVSQHVCHFIQIPQPSVWPRRDISPHLVSLSSFVFDASEI